MAVDQVVASRSAGDPPKAERQRQGVLPLVLLVAGTLLLSLVARYLLALKLTAPWLMGDELRYSEMAKSFQNEGELLFREELTSFATAYPALISPAWIASDIGTAYSVAKAINVVLMTLTALVAFVWARRLVPTWYALVAGGLVLLMPTFTYSGMLMMENAALPAFLLAAYVIARALERPLVVWQLAVFGAVALGALMRVQILTLAVVYPTAILLEAFFARRSGARTFRESFTRFLPSFVIIALGAVAYVLFKVVSGRPLASGLGAYDTVGRVGYDKIDVLRWSAWHAGELAFSVGILPAITVGALLAAASARGGLSSAGDRAFVAVATSATFWFVLQAGAYASRFSGRIEERYMVYAAPLLLIAFVVWLSRELSRTGVAMYAAAIIPALLVMTIPFERVFNLAIVADTFGLIPLFRLSSVVSGIDDVRIVLVAGLAVAVMSFFVFSMRWARIVFPSALAVFFLLSGYTVYGAIEDQSTAAHAATGVADENWVDDAVGTSGEVGFVYGSSVSVNPHLLWQTEFWNRSVRRVYPLETDPTAAYSRDELKVDADGRLTPKGAGSAATEPYVLADPGLGIVGDVIARPGPLALIRVSRPLRVGSSVNGVHPDGWSGPSASLTQYMPLPASSRRMRVRVSRAGWTGQDVPSRVAIAVGPVKMTEGGPTLARTTATREWVVHSGLTRTFDIPVPPAPFRIEVTVSPTFSPAQFGQADARQLGVQLAFEPPAASR
jgi:hypothetical protein